jgi:hypothetical protein
MPISPTRAYVLLLAGVIGILSIASVVGFALKTMVARGEPHSTIDNPIRASRPGGGWRP